MRRTHPFDEVVRVTPRGVHIAAEDDHPVDQVGAGTRNQQREHAAVGPTDEMCGLPDHRFEVVDGLLEQRRERVDAVRVGTVAVAAALGNIDLQPHVHEPGDLGAPGGGRRERAVQ